MFFRLFQHLLPRARAWSTVVNKQLRQFFDGLGGAFEDAKEFAQQLWTDYPAATTTELARWVSQWGLGTGSESDQRLALSAARKATGGQGPDYLEGILQTAGFDLYVHGPWVPASDPVEARDPSDWFDDVLIGLTQCGDPDIQCGNPDAVCDLTVLQRAGYLVNKDLTSRAGPRLPTDSTTWGHFIYIGGETFGDRVDVSEDRRDELERTLLTYFPAECWLGLFVDYGTPIATESGFVLITEGGEEILAE